MESTLDYIAKEHGGIREYLFGIGLSADAMQRIRGKFIHLP
jgi:hypothetical protein